ncbi:hypothetical protein Acsp04_66790 [Actinomadura sp. NBRC 104425]|nr:hypothetical protein Acsp04_66790 [Actinomadura sp. NBRC 104425]
MRGVREERRLEVDDVAEAVAERLSRQQYLRTHRRFVFLIEEAVLWYRMFAPEVHREQLLHLEAVTRGAFSQVTLGVILQRADRGGYRVRESFEIIDDGVVAIELLSGYLRLTHPDEVAMYREAWRRLHALAVVGGQARALIAAARQSLG